MRKHLLVVTSRIVGKCFIGVFNYRNLKGTVKRKQVVVGNGMTLYYRIWLHSQDGTASLAWCFRGQSSTFILRFSQLLRLLRLTSTTIKYRARAHVTISDNPLPWKHLNNHRRTYQMPTPLFKTNSKICNRRFSTRSSWTAIIFATSGQQGHSSGEAAKQEKGDEGCRVKRR